MAVISNPLSDTFLRALAYPYTTDLPGVEQVYVYFGQVIGRSVENSVYKSAREQKKDIAEVTKALSMLYRQNKDTGAVHDAAVKGVCSILCIQL